MEDMTINNDPDWTRLDAETQARLRRHLHHVGLDGEPCIEPERLAELLALDAEGLL